MNFSKFATAVSLLSNDNDKNVMLEYLLSDCMNYNGFTIHNLIMSYTDEEEKITAIRLFSSKDFVIEDRLTSIVKQFEKHKIIVISLLTSKCRKINEIDLEIIVKEIKSDSDKF